MAPTVGGVWFSTREHRHPTISNPPHWRGSDTTEMVHGRARAPPTQTWRVVVNEGRLRVGKVNPVEGHEQKIFLLMHANGFRMSIVNMQAT